MCSEPHKARPDALTGSLTNSQGEVDYLLLHRAEDRWDTYARLTGLRWEDGLEAWISAEPRVLREILRNPSIETIDFRKIYQTLAERLSMDFGVTLEILDHVALGLNGTEHRDIRREQTLFLKNGSDAALEAFETDLAECLPPLMRSGGNVDFANQVVAPALSTLFSAWIGVPVNDNTCGASLSQVFDRYLGLNRRRDINRRVEDRLTQMAARCERREAAMRVALSIVGADSIFGGFSQSLAHIFSANAGKKLCEIEWPGEMPRTGVPYVDRIAARDVVIDGTEISAGDRLRLYVEQLGCEQDGRPAELFGLGTHVCLGKALTQRAWKALTEILSTFDARVCLLEYQYRRPDFLFNAPRKMEVSITHD